MGVRGGALGAAFALGVVCVGTVAATADPTPPFDWLTRRLFFFAGADIARDTAFGWSGIVVAPFAHLDEDGTRIRIFGGHGRYRYDTGAVPGGINTGLITSGELLIGRRIAFDAVTLVAYAGAHVEHHALQAPDPANPVAGTSAGLKALLEVHWRALHNFVATASLSASTVNRSYTARASLVHEFQPAFQLGGEAAAFGDARYAEQRAGVLIRTKLTSAELTLAAGLLSNSNKGSGAYTTLTLYAPF
jgi:hypothetical protein